MGLCAPPCPGSLGVLWPGSRKVIPMGDARHVAPAAPDYADPGVAGEVNILLETVGVRRQLQRSTAEWRSVTRTVESGSVGFLHSEPFHPAEGV